MKSQQIKVSKKIDKKKLYKKLEQGKIPRQKRVNGMIFV